MLTFASCNYLDVKPTGMVIPESVTEFRAMMTSAYSKIPKHKKLLTVRADEVFPYAWEWGSYSTHISIATWEDNVNESYVPTYPWLEVYRPIFYTNSVIDDVMSSTIDTKDDSREQLKGEALLLRAYLHFELLNLYAVPYNKETASKDRGIPLALTIDTEQKYHLASVEAVYDQILTDIEEGEKLLTVEEQPASVRYRFSKKAAKALEARVHLYRSEWETALRIAEDLLPQCDLENLNEADAKAPYDVESKESILAMEYTTDGDILGNMYILPNLMEKYDVNRDLRVNIYFYKDGDDYKGNKGNNERITFRSGEIYLIAAEAAAHVEGKLGQAKDYLKRLIVNRLIPEYYAERENAINSMNQEDLLREIMDERARELALEGHRWYDLRRTNRPQIVKHYLDMDGVKQTATLQANDPKYTIPFPKDAVDNNPNLNNWGN